ncbi:periodic tryptophan protein 2 homolog [Tubulanus polymorphus]|uniref:periodic tryptophan protein 2 homolog n=1 Tax=Tubulanus polymorphus TaxID=672921 RepID=UPI003DA55033
MKFSYRFSNLLGTVYRKGNLSFSPDGNTVISPVGNRISLFDLKNNKSETLPVEGKMNLSALGLSPDGNILIAIDEEGEAMLISMISKTVLHYHHFHGSVNSISFSPNGKKFAITKNKIIQMFHAPGKTKEFNPFVPYRTFYGAFDETTCIDWTTDSRVFCVGGKDMNTRVYGAQPFRNLIIYSIGGHSDAIVGTFFEADSLDLYTLSSNGQLCVWECNTDLDGLLPFEEKKVTSDEESDLDDDEKKAEKEKALMKAAQESKDEKILFKRLAKHRYKDNKRDGSQHTQLTCAMFHKKSHILVAGFEDGSFLLHEMPDFNLIHSLSISNQMISSIAINTTGDWIALGCSGLGQLLVWEWQSESYVLKQQGHFNNMTCLVYSPDGQYLVTGGDDGKVKVWNTSSGFCFVTFSEHNAGITGVAFSQSGQVVLSSSLDGTVRAFDLNRYRNFRTFTSPQPVQFSSLAIDPSGEIVCAGGMDSFDIFVWSLQTGRLLDILSGHEGPVSAVVFSTTSSILASASWDKTVKLWDVFENKGSKETFRFNTDVQALAYRPDGKEIAVGTLDAQISFWDVQNGTQTGSIEGRHDLGYTRKDTDKITAKTSSVNKSFSTISYTADGKCILAGGRSKNVCIYSVEDQMLIKKFEVSCNLSFNGMEEYLDRRKMTEWGSLALVDSADGKSLSLPGVKKGDMSSRHWKPEVRVYGVSFSPTGRAWASTTTEGLLIYSLDNNLTFDPFELDIDITPENVKGTLKDNNYSTALMLAFRLNEQNLIQQVLETIPLQSIELICQSLPDVYVDKLLAHLGSALETSPHLEFYMNWCQKLLYNQGSKLKQRSQSVIAHLRAVQKILNRRKEDIGKMCDQNRYSLQYLITLSQLKNKRKADSQAADLDKENEDNEGNEEMDEDDNDDDVALPSNWESDSDDVETLMT